MKNRDLKADLEWIRKERTNVKLELALIKNKNFYAQERREALKLLITYNAIEIVTKQALTEECRANNLETSLRELTTASRNAMQHHLVSIANLEAVIGDLRRVGAISDFIEQMIRENISESKKSLFELKKKLEENE